MNYALTAALAAGIFVTATVEAQVRTLQLDINNVAFQARDGAGTPGPFGGTTHTGALHMTFDSVSTEIVGVLMRDDPGPFMLQPQFTGALTNTLVHIDLNNGAVMGGSMSFDIDGGPASIGGNRYTADILPGGNIMPFAGGGFQVEGLSASGMFSGPDWGGVDISDFFAAQGGPFLPGWFFSFRIQPDSQGAGFADIDVWVQNIPAPGSLMLLAAGGLLAARRRR